MTTRIYRVERVGDDDVARAIDKNTRGKVQFCSCGQHAIDVAWGAGRAGDGLNVAGAGNYFANGGVAEIGYEDVARAIHKYGVRQAQVRAERRTAVATGLANTAAAGIVVNADDSLDVAGTGHHFTNDRIFRVGNEDVS